MKSDQLLQTIQLGFTIYKRNTSDNTFVVGWDDMKKENYQIMENLACFWCAGHVRLYGTFLTQI